MFGMARDGALPKALATVDPRTRTPRTAVLVSAVFTILIAIAAAVREDGLEVLSSMVTVGALVGFLFLHAAVIGYYVRGRRTEQRTRHIVVPVVGAVIIAIVLALAAHLALAIAAVWLAIGVVVLVIRESRRQDPQRS
jgi:amino acid transporter